MAADRDRLDDAAQAAADELRREVAMVRRAEPTIDRLLTAYLRERDPALAAELDARGYGTTWREGLRCLHALIDAGDARRLTQRERALMTRLEAVLSRAQVAGLAPTDAG